jgi:phosphate starvation-inducible PhoH-like protein
MEIKKTFLLDNIDLVSAFSQEQFFDQLERRFDSTVILRGNSIITVGQKSEVEVIEKIIDQLNYIYIKNGSITDEDLKKLIDFSKKDEDVDTYVNVETKIVYNGYKDSVKVKNKKQEDYLSKVLNNDIVFAIGPAGTGKTFLAVAMALNALKNNEVSRIILTRPAVEAGESLGFLPGDLNEKIDPYLRPLIDALQFMLSPEKLKSLKERNIIEINPLAYMRGRTLSNAFIILDEAQNSTSSQMKMFLTRLGFKSKAIITGDITQIDLPRKAQSGLVEIESILKGIKGIDFIHFDNNDVVRHKLVADIIRAYEKLENNQK